MKRTAFCVPDWTAWHSGGNVYNRKIWEHLHSVFPETYILNHRPSSLDASYDAILSDSLFLGETTQISGGDERILLVHFLKHLRPDLYDRNERAEEFRLLEQFDAFICTGKSTFNIMRKWYPNGRLKLLEPGLGEIELSEIESPAANEPLKVMLGSNLAPEKDVLPFLFELERQVQGGHFPIHHTETTLFGEADLQADYAGHCLNSLRRIRSAGMNIMHRRPIDRAKYLNELNQAHLFIHPAKTEAFGMAVIEAVRSGLPVLLREGANSAHAVIHGKNGMICSDIRGLMKSWKSLITSHIANGSWTFVPVQALKFPDWKEQAEELHRWIQDKSFES